jgi:hypothetical protein
MWVVADTHEAWVDRCARWERLYNEKCAEVERLRAQVGHLEAQLRVSRGLTRQNLRDSCVAEPGGVSDGTQ